MSAVELGWTEAALRQRILEDIRWESGKAALAGMHIDVVSEAKSKAAQAALNHVLQFVSGKTISQIEAIARDRNDPDFYLANTVVTRYLSRALIQTVEVPF